MQEIQNTHYSKNEEEFQRIKEKTLLRWDAVKDLKAFSDFFKKQWLDIDFVNWQIYVSIPGFVSTNNSIEIFNGPIKTDDSHKEYYPFLDKNIKQDSIFF